MWSTNPFEYTTPNGSWTVQIEWEERWGRLNIVGLSVHSNDGSTSPITNALLRGLPLADRVEDANKAQIKELDALLGQSTVSADGEYRPPFAGPGGRLPRGYNGGRPREYSGEHYGKVAAVYAAAYRTGNAPTKAVAEYFTVSRATAAKWVATARKRNLLEATKRGMARGVQPPGGALGSLDG